MEMKLKTESFALMSVSLWGEEQLRNELLDNKKSELVIFRRRVAEVWASEMTLESSRCFCVSMETERSMSCVAA